MRSAMNSNAFENPAVSAAPADAARFVYKATPDDFIVEELPLYEPSGSGTHTWLWIEKRGMTSHAVARALAQRLHKNPADAGNAGL